MFTKTRMHFALAALLVLIAALALTSSAHAGGWAVITLDELPGPVVAGRPVSLGLMARQHGRTPWQVTELVVEARQVDTGTALTFSAKPDQPPGHYQAELLFPEPGRWEWSIASGLYPPSQPMPDLEVADGSLPAGTAADPSTGAAGLPNLPAPFLGVFALLAFAAGLGLIARSRSNRNRRFPFLAGLALMVLCAASAFAFFESVNARAGPVEPVPVTGGDAAAGQQLFLAKGCVICHTNNRAIQRSAEYGVNVGPNLTDYRGDPDFLRRWLKDPQSVRADTSMPNLGLKQDEIEALVAFLNDHGE